MSRLLCIDILILWIVSACAVAQPLGSCICFFSISFRIKYSHQETDTCTVISRVHCTILAGAHQNIWIIPSLSHNSLKLTLFLPATFQVCTYLFSKSNPTFPGLWFFFFLLECFLWSLFYTIPSPHQIERKTQTSEYNLQRQTFESFSKLFCLKPIIVFSRKPNWFCSPWRAWCCKNQIRFQQLIMGITFFTWCRRDLYYVMYVITMKLYIYNIGIQSLQWDTFIRAFPDSLNCLFWRRYQLCYSFSQDPSITEKTRL